MRLQTLSALWLILIAGLLVHAGKSAADSTGTPASSLSGEIAFIQIKADHIVNRSAVLTHFFSAILTGSFILVAWRIYSNPVEAIQAVWSFGISLHVNPLSKPLSEASGGYENRRLNIAACKADKA